MTDFKRYRLYRKAEGDGIPELLLEDRDNPKETTLVAARAMRGSPKYNDPKNPVLFDIFVTEECVIDDIGGVCTIHGRFIVRCEGCVADKHSIAVP